MILFRSLFAQLLVPYALGASILTFILSMDTIYRLINLIISKGVDVLTVGLMLLYRLPQFLSITLPIAVVITVCILMVRLSADSEVIALQASGVSFWSVARPILAFGALSSVIGWLITLWIQPMGYAAFEEEQLKLFKTYTAKNIQERTMNYDFSGKVMYVQSKQGDHAFEDVFIADRDMGVEGMAVVAANGRLEILEAQQNIQLQLQDGEVHLPSETDQSYRLLQFEKLRFELNPPDIVSGNRHIWGYSTQQLYETKSHRAQLELLLRLTTPLTSLAFAIATMVVSIYDPRRGRSGAYLKALIVVAAYYILWILSKELSHGVKMTPQLLWIPPLVILGYGLYSVYKIEHRLKHIADVLRFAKSKV